MANTRGLVAPADVRAWVSRLEKEVGTGGASAKLELSRETISRLIAGLTVHKSTISHVRAAMQEET